MLLSVVYALVCLLADPVSVRWRDARARDTELLALRHEVRVLRRRVKRAAWPPGGRFVLAVLSRGLARPAWGILPVRPETLLRWHRGLVGRQWAAFGRRRGPGRPPLPAEVRGLIGRLATENPRWGYRRVRGELRKLGHGVSATAIRALLRRRGIPPAPRRARLSWRTFLRAHAERWVGTARRGCPDWLLVLGQRHLARVLRECVEHYNAARPHRAPQPHAPVGRGGPDSPVGEIVRRDRLGGLIHEYERLAA